MNVTALLAALVLLPILVLAILVLLPLVVLMGHARELMFAWGAFGFLTVQMELRIVMKLE